MTVYAPVDDVVSPIAQALLNIAQTQLSGIQTFYAYETDGPPDHNSFMVMDPQFEVTDDTNGRLFLLLKFRLCLRYQQVVESVDTPPLRSYIMPMLSAYSAWDNNELGGLARLISVRSGGIVRELYAGTPYKTLVLTVNVETEYNIPTGE